MTEMIEDVSAFSTFQNDSVGPQNSKMLRDRGLWHHERVFEIGDRSLPVAQLFNNQHAQGMSKYAKESGKLF